MLCSVISGLSVCGLFFVFFSETSPFKKKKYVFALKRVLIALQNLPETFHIPGRIRRNSIINYLGLYMKLLLFWCDFKQLEFSRNILIKSPVLIMVQICAVEAEFFSCGQTDGMTRLSLF